MKDKNLLLYIFGLITGFILIPVTEEMLNVIYSWIEVLKIKPASIVSEWNEKVTAQNEEGEHTYAIGFQAPDPELEDDFEEEW